MTTPSFSGGIDAAQAEAEWLDAHFEACAPEYRSMLDAAGIRPGDHVLDLGCGNGRFLPWIANAAGARGKVTAVDMSVANARRAAEMAAGLQLPVVIAADVLSLPLASGVADVAWCANTFEYLSADEQQRCLQELIRVLRPGGTIAVKDSEFTHKIFHPVPLELWFTFLARMAVDTGGGPFVGRGLPGAFRRAGLTPVCHTILAERAAPLSPADLRWIGISSRAVAADAARLLGAQRNVEVEALARLFDEQSEACILHDDGFYYCEGSIVVTAQTPA